MGPISGSGTGWVWLAGAGPGDPGLLTLHALNGLRQADVVVYDALVDDSVLSFAPKGTQLDYAGKRGGKPSPKQRDITLKLIDYARAGKRVIRLKGGDPFVFGRGGEEALGLVEAVFRSGSFQVSPPASAVWPMQAFPLPTAIAIRAVTFLTGHDQTGLTPGALNWEGIAKGSQVIVMYIAMKHLNSIAGKLIECGRSVDEPVGIVCNSSLAGQQVLETTLGRCAEDAANANMTPPAIVCIGEVVRLRAGLDWLGALSGRALAADPLGSRPIQRAPMPADTSAMPGPKGFLIAAPASNAGKTTVTLALLRALRRQGIRAVSAKSGPDYIDPKFHEAASGKPCINLDAWAMSKAQISAMAKSHSTGQDVLVIEGAMGLFDCAANGTGSAADLASGRLNLLLPQNTLIFPSPLSSSQHTTRSLEGTKYEESRFMGEINGPRTWSREI